LPPSAILDRIRTANGRSGDNVAYVINTVGHLRRLGIHDPTLEWLAEALESGGEGHPVRSEVED
jgi:cation transport regulator ChaC